jgi:hypothetical protein
MIGERPSEAQQCIDTLLLRRFDILLQLVILVPDALGCHQVEAQHINFMPMQRNRLDHRVHGIKIGFREGGLYAAGVLTKRIAPKKGGNIKKIFPP